MLTEIQVPGDREAASDLHITLLNLGDALPISTIARVTEVAYEVIATFQPFTVKTTKIIGFPEGKHGVPVVCEIESESLHALWGRLGEAFDKAGIEYSKKFPIYRPHVTLSWSDRPFKPIKLPPVEWGVSEITIWGGDQGERRVMVNIPITIASRAASKQSIVLGSRVTSTERVVLRFQLTKSGIWST